ncbi:MAG TPA: DNA primase [Chthoniobacterales bacterium]
MPLISEESIRQVAEANDIVEVIGSYFPLKKAGASLRALCPFHREKSPSFHVNPARQTYHCFGCGAGGGVIKFVMEYEQLDFPAAVRNLAQRAGITLIEEISADSDRGERARLLAMHAAAADWFHQHLMRSRDAAPAREYLKGRGLTQQIAKDWKLGYAPEAWDALLDFLRGQQFSAAEILCGGLTTTRENESDPAKAYDRFRARLMIPIRNDYGEVIGFSGRVLDPDAKTAKYVNSPETPLFTKGRVLFGLDRTKRALIEARAAIVCEGQIDLITAYESGIPNVIAPQGTAFTLQQARLLKRFVDTVILCFDSDTAGEKAVDRSLPSLFDQDLTVKMILLPAGEDPDSLIRKKGADAFAKLVGEAREVFDFKLKLAEQRGEFATAQSRSQLARRFAALLGFVTDPVLRRTIVALIAARLEVPIDQLSALIPAKPALPDSEEIAPAPANEPPIVLGETMATLCRLALADPEARRWLARQDPTPLRELGPDFAVLQAILDSELPAGPAFLAGLPARLQNAISVLDLEKLPPNPLEMAQKYWTGMLGQHLRIRQRAAQSRLRLPNLDATQMIEIQKEILDLDQRLMDISRPISSVKPA